MTNEGKSRDGNDKGAAIVTVLMLTALLSILVGSLVVSSTADVLISGNELRANQSYYIAEAGINRAAAWFNAKFGYDPNSGLVTLPEQFPSYSIGDVGKLCYIPTSPIYAKGTNLNSPQQKIPTAVKVLDVTQLALQNVVIAGDDSNTYPTSYVVNANDPYGIAKKFTFADVVSDFKKNLYEQPVGAGKFSIKATLISINLLNNLPQGTITWLIESTGRITRGADTAIASTTLWAYLTAPVIPIKATVTSSGGEQITAGPGIIAQGRVASTANGVKVDSYKSSKGAYGSTLPANSFLGQLGLKNIGSHGDMRTNNNPQTEGINFKNGSLTGSVASTLPKPLLAILFDPLSVLNLGDGLGGLFLPLNKRYGQNSLSFPAVPDSAAPTAGSPNYSYDMSNQTATLPPGNYNDISVTSGTLIVPPGSYGGLTLGNQGTLVLGAKGQNSFYNFQGFTTGTSARIEIRGPVTINVGRSFDLGAVCVITDAALADSAVRWNFSADASQIVNIGGTGKTIGVIYAPNNSLHVRSGADFYGAIIARTVDIDGTASIHIDEDAATGVQTTASAFNAITVTASLTAAQYKLGRITQVIN